ncbi:hypothetical protein [Vulgatibacter sp.]|uniref:hypothetical protein n=1 Tax=Vulgatibacter sp. TaxID=1971226 RepID=UPI0035633162
MRRLFLLGVLLLGACTEDGLDRTSGRIEDGGEGSALIDEGREVFRFDTFGSEGFFGGTLGLHRAIAGAANGGVGPGVSPTAALGLGLKVDAEALPAEVVAALQAGELDLEDPATTLALLQAEAVVGVRGFFDEAGTLTAIGTTCAFCHSTVDDSFAPGIGRRLDGWANRDLNVGAIVAASPDLGFFVDALQVDEATVRQVLESWGPGRYDALLVLDGKAFKPDGTTASVVIPPAFGLAGVNLATYTGFGDVTYWNAYVANTQMHGLGTFYDPRLDDPEKYPVAARLGLGNIRSEEDRITAVLPALHVYQLSLLAPTPPAGSFDAAAAERGRAVFEEQGRCASCHVPPVFSEPGHNLHDPAEIGIDDFHASRSPTGMYRTTPLGGLFTREKGGFYHDGRFADLRAVVDHYDATLGLGLAEADKNDLVEYLRSL